MSADESRGRSVPPPKRRGDWMQTYTGKAFWPMDPRPEEIDPDDIAHALGMLCRYGGHVSDFYSVAEHCVLMSYAVAPENALTALLHDATEAYICDIPRPLKRSLPAYQDAETVLWWALAARFGVGPDLPAEVKQADNRILRDERDALMHLPTPLPWGIDDLPPLGVEIQRWSPADAAEQWINRLVDLTGLTPPWDSSLSGGSEVARTVQGV